MEVDGKTYVLKVTDFNDCELVGEDDKGQTYHIPRFKMGIYKVIGELPKEMHLYICKNETTVCKGMRMYEYSTALAMCKKNLFIRYYGNPK